MASKDTPAAEESLHTKLRAALSAGDPRQVRELINLGADIHYKDENGYDALIHAMYGRNLLLDKQLVELLTLLIESGVSVRGKSNYGETGLSVVSCVGRFDVVQLLLNAGADRNELQWSPLIEAVALGSIDDVRKAVANGADLEARDCWNRTAWHVALLAGDIDKAAVLREQGAITNATSHCGQPAIFFPVKGRQAAMLQWLLKSDVDVEQADDFGGTALHEAIEQDDAQCVRILLESGADCEREGIGTPLENATSAEVILSLLDAGADPAKLKHDGQRALLDMPPISPDELASITKENFLVAATQSFGKSNPQRMDHPFWLSMIRCGVCAYEARRHFDAMPDSLRDPVWCAQRFGQSFTPLTDGRIILVGGEHEDFYDPDFCIYNDVFVHEPTGSVTVFGYPAEVFPPTDFHTATLVGNHIYLIGRLGYAQHRKPGLTPVLRLSLQDWRIETVETTGDCPGWIYSHRADLTSDHQIRVRGGEIVTGSGGEEEHSPNAQTYLLDLNTKTWSKEPSDTMT